MTSGGDVQGTIVDMKADAQHMATCLIHTYIKIYIAPKSYKTNLRCCLVVIEVCQYTHRMAQ